MPTIQPYVLESMVLSHFEARTEATAWVDIEFMSVLRSISSAIFLSIPDPKRIQGDLNHLTSEERLEISAKAIADLKIGGEARSAEEKDDHRTAIRLWAQVFGPDFPAFG